MVPSSPQTWLSLSSHHLELSAIHSLLLNSAHRQSKDRRQPPSCGWVPWDSTSPPLLPRPSF